MIAPGAPPLSHPPHPGSAAATQNALLQVNPDGQVAVHICVHAPWRQIPVMHAASAAHAAPSAPGVGGG